MGRDFKPFEMYLAGEQLKAEMNVDLRKVVIESYWHIEGDEEATARSRADAKKRCLLNENFPEIVYFCESLVEFYYAYMENRDYSKAMVDNTFYKIDNQITDLCRNVFETGKIPPYPSQKEINEALTSKSSDRLETITSMWFYGFLDPNFHYRTVNTNKFVEAVDDYIKDFCKKKVLSIVIDEDDGERFEDMIKGFNHILLSKERRIDLKHEAIYTKYDFINISDNDFIYILSECLKQDMRGYATNYIPNGMDAPLCYSLHDKNFKAFFEKDCSSKFELLSPFYKSLTDIPFSVLGCEADWTKNNIRVKIASSELGEMDIRCNGGEYGSKDTEYYIICDTKDVIPRYIIGEEKDGIGHIEMLTDREKAFAVKKLTDVPEFNEAREKMKRHIALKEEGKKRKKISLDK